MLSPDTETLKPNMAPLPVCVCVCVCVRARVISLAEQWYFPTLTRRNNSQRIKLYASVQDEAN